MADATSEEHDLARKQSSFRRPDPKAPLSARVRSSTIEKLDAIVRIWRAKELAEAGRAVDPEVRRAAEERAEQIDRTYAIDALLATASDDELALHGGLPETEEQWKTLLAGIKHGAQ